MIGAVVVEAAYANWCLRIAARHQHFLFRPAYRGQVLFAWTNPARNDGSRQCIRAAHVSTASCRSRVHEKGEMTAITFSLSTSLAWHLSLISSPFHPLRGPLLISLLSAQLLYQPDTKVNHPVHRSKMRWLIRCRSLCS